MVISHGFGTGPAAQEALGLPGILYAGPHDGDKRSDVKEATRLEFHRHPSASRRLDLKQSGGMPVPDGVPYVRVGEVCIAEGLEVHGGVVGRLDELGGLVESVEMAQSEEVELDPAHLLDVPHVPLGGNDLVGGAVVAGSQRNQAQKRLVVNEDPRRMLSVVAGHSGHLPDPLEQFGVLLNPGDEVATLGGQDLIPSQVILAGLFVGILPLLGDDGHALLDDLGHLLQLGIGHLHGPADILEHPLGPIAADRAHSANVILTVACLEVVVHPAQSGLGEVHVHVRVSSAIGIQESLEEEIVFDGIEVGDAEQPGDQAPPCRSPSWTYTHRCGMAMNVLAPAAILSRADVVRHREEVPGEAPLADQRQFRLHTAEVALSVQAAIDDPALESDLDLVDKGGDVFLLPLSEGGQGEHRRDLGGTGLGDIPGGVDGLSHSSPTDPVALHPEVQLVIAHVVIGLLTVAELVSLVFVDPVGHVLLLPILRPGVVAVVDDDEGNAELVGQTQLGLVQLGHLCIDGSGTHLDIEEVDPVITTRVDELPGV